MRDRKISSWSLNAHMMDGDLLYNSKFEFNQNLGGSVILGGLERVLNLFAFGLHSLSPKRPSPFSE